MGRKAVRVPGTRSTPHSWAGPAGLWEGHPVHRPHPLPMSLPPWVRRGTQAARAVAASSSCIGRELDSARSLRSSLGCPAGFSENEGVLRAAEGAAPLLRKTGFFWAFRRGASAGAAAPAAHVLR